MGKDAGIEEVEAGLEEGVDAAAAVVGLHEVGQDQEAGGLGGVGLVDGLGAGDDGGAVVAEAIEEQPGGGFDDGAVGGADQVGVALGKGEGVFGDLEADVGGVGAVGGRGALLGSEGLGAATVVVGQEGLPGDGAGADPGADLVAEVAQDVLVDEGGEAAEVFVAAQEGLSGALALGSGLADLLASVFDLALEAIEVRAALAGGAVALVLGALEVVEVAVGALLQAQQVALDGLDLLAQADPVGVGELSGA